MVPVLALCGQLPELKVAAGQALIRQGLRGDRLYVLRSGAFEVVRGEVRVTTIDEPGAFLGEISAVLGSHSTADVIATEDSVVHVVEHASEAVRKDPELTFAIAHLLARRLLAVTAYLVDIKQQYGDTDTHLAVMDRVLARLMAGQPGTNQPGSERADVPDY
jgi:CRP/FNR family transcriptional regulator, cyclic AMP receptor protein